MKNLFYLSEHRHATWLELFFDLVFVAVIGVITHKLAYTTDGEVHIKQIIQFPLAFIPLWWIWATHTLFSNRFDNYHAVQRIFTLLVMALVIVFSTFVKGSMDEKFVYFVLSYALIRLILAAAYLVVYRQMSGKADFTLQIGATIAAGAIISASAVFIESNIKFAVFFGGIVFDMGVQAALRNKIKDYPVHRNHLVERIGLLSIIILGETVINLVGSLSKVDMTPQDVVASFVGFFMLGALWWIYFGTLHLLEHAKRVKTGVVIMYCHLPFSMGLIIMANLVGHAILEDLNRATFAAFATVGLSLFYLGKQIPYMAAYPPLRLGIVVNTAICIAITVISTMLPSFELAMLGMTGGMILYVVLYTFVVFPRTDISEFSEPHTGGVSFANRANEVLDVTQN